MSHTHTHMHTHSVEYCTVIKKGWDLAICKVDAPKGYYAKWNKSEKEKYHMNLPIYGIWETKHMNTENKSRTRPII